MADSQPPQAGIAYGIICHEIPLLIRSSSETTGPSKNELKKRAKELEKEKKKAERLANEAEQQQKAKAAAEVVSPFRYQPSYISLNILQDCSGTPFRGLYYERRSNAVIIRAEVW
jgi:aspartyl-tRNA synthetase